MGAEAYDVCANVAKVLIFSALLMFVCAALTKKTLGLVLFLENNIFAEGYLTAFILPRMPALFQRMWPQEWREILLR